MMNNDEVPRGMPYQQPMRKPYQSKYQDNRYISSPSASYNYNSGNGYAGQQQHPRRRVDRFKRETINYSERIMKQNDLIIRLLKEIRDRLPAPPVSAHFDNPTSDATRQNGHGEDAFKSEEAKIEPQEMPADAVEPEDAETMDLDEPIQAEAQPHPEQ